MNCCSLMSFVSNEKLSENSFSQKIRETQLPDLLLQTSKQEQANNSTNTERNRSETTMDLNQQQCVSGGKRKQNNDSYVQSVLELSDRFQETNATKAAHSTVTKKETHEMRACYKKRRLFLSTQYENVFQFRDYINCFCSEEQQNYFEKRLTAVTKENPKKYYQELKNMKKMEFKVKFNNIDAVDFISNYEEKSIFTAELMQKPYNDLLRETTQKLSQGMENLKQTLGKQFFFFLTSNYKLLQYPEEENAEMAYGLHTDWVRAFVESKSAKLKKEEDDTDSEKNFSDCRRITSSLRRPSFQQVGDSHQDGINSSVHSNPSTPIFCFNRSYTGNHSPNKNIPNTLSDDHPHTGYHFSLEDTSKEGKIQQCIPRIAVQAAGQPIEKSLSNVSLTIGSKKQTTSDKSIPKDKPKRTNNFYNLPRYFMMLILELLSPQNISGLDIPQGTATSIQRMRVNLRKIGRKSEATKSNFYNHTHYSCLFRLLGSDATNGIPSFSLEKVVFEIDELQSSFSLCHSNCLKLIVSALVVQQLTTILELPLVKFIKQNAEQYPQEKIKIDYVTRVLNGIQKLNSGQPINRF